MGSNRSARSGTAGRVVGVALTFAFVAAAALTLGGLAPARGAEPALRWKFNEGETLNYRMDQKTVTQVKANGQDIKTTVTQTIDTTWAVTSVDRETGVAGMTQTIDRLQTRIESPFGAFEYDSKSDKVPEGPIAAGIVPTLKALVGSRFEYKISPQGELSDVKVPEGLVKAMKEAGSPGGSVGMFSEEGLKNMIHESSLILPSDIEKGKSWNRQTKIPSPPIGTMLMDKTYTYLGADKEGLDKIDLTVTVKLEADPKSNLEIKLGDQEGKGTFNFDHRAGRVASSNVTEKIEMVIKVMGQEINQSTDMTTAMKLLDAKVAAPR